MVSTLSIGNPAPLKGYSTSKRIQVHLGQGARGQDEAEFKADFDFPWIGDLISLPERGGCPIKRTCKYIWLWESNSLLGKPITFPEPCYILNFSLFMAHIKWLELPHTFPSPSLKIVQSFTSDKKLILHILRQQMASKSPNVTAQCTDIHI